MSTNPVWWPGGGLLKESNIARFMVVHEIDNFESLLARSQQEIEWFWDAVVRFLGLEWSRPYDTVLDTSKGIAWSQWFTGGTLNVAHNCVVRHAQRDPKALALVLESEDGSTRRVTYGELRALTARMATTLTRRGITAGDVVGISMPMIPETVAAIMAAAALGAVFVPLFSGFGPDAIVARLRDAGASAVVTVDGFERRGRIVRSKGALDAALDDLPRVHSVIVVERIGLDDLEMRGPRDEWFDPTGPFDDLDPMALPSEHPLLLGYTSGTTGQPKSAVHVHGGFLVKVAQEIAFQFDLRAQATLAAGPLAGTDPDLFFWCTDIGWIMGPWEIVGVLANGGAVMLYDGAPDHPDPTRLWELVERHRVTTLGVSPTLVRSLMTHGELPLVSHDLSSLRILGSSGEPWNEVPWRWFFENVGASRCPIINVSGGTEVGACFLSPHVTQPLSACSLGGPALGMALDIYDQDGQSLRGAVGELVCTQPWPAMTRGIWGDPDRYIETYWSRWSDTWVHGDWASIGPTGEWFLHGRSDDTIKLAGKRLGPAEVENLLVEHAAVVEAAAIGIPDATKGELLSCYVVLRRGEEPTEELRAQLADVVADGLGKAFRPASVRFVRALPKTRSSKILRRTIRALAVGQEPGDISSLEDRGTLDAVLEAQ